MTANITRTDLERSLPDVTSTIRSSLLQQPVEIVRDSFGIPHIRAHSEYDAFFAQGFVTAQDRLWHMDYDRQRALGRWSALVGESGITEDRFMRTFGLEQAARADLEVTSEPARQMLNAYTDGVNAFLDSTQTLPVEYQLLQATPEPWQTWHCLAVYKIRNMLMGTFEIKLWRARLAQRLGPARAAALFQGYPETGLVSIPPGDSYGGEELNGLDELAAAARELNWLDEEDGGSNAWAIGGTLTRSGLPLVAGDSHRALDTPNVYYQNHLTCPTFRCSGYSLPGVPGMPHFSHTDFVGWGMTHGFGDYQDLYIERFRLRDDSLQYLFRDEWKDAQVSAEHISVRGSADLTLSVVRTQHGPIIAGNPENGHGIAFRHPGTSEATPWANTIYELLIARNADEAEEALRDWTEPVNNFVYGDVHGQFGYRYRGRIPIRSSDNGWVPVPGWTGEHEWQAQIPFEEMPAQRNPESGFVVTCNNAPVTADYPHYINTFFAPDWRARRVTTRAQALGQGSADVDSMASIHADRQSLPAEILQRRVRELTATSAEEQASQTLLLDWDCCMDRNSPAATLYASMRAHILTEVVSTALGDMADEAIGSSGIGRGAATHTGQIYHRAVLAMEADDNSCLRDNQTWPELIHDALTRATTSLHQSLGDDPQSWRWGEVHRTRPVHPLARRFPDSAELLNPPRFATHGDSDTPLAGAYSLLDRFTSTLMSVNRYIHDPSDWRNSRWIVPLGSSGHPGSQHYSDQGALWADVRTVPQLWEWSDILEAAESSQRLEPDD